MAFSGIQLITLPKILDPRGNLTFVQSGTQVPFPIQRIFWTYDIPGGADRGGHAYYRQEELIIALSGSFDVVITKRDQSTECYPLNRSNRGLYLPSLTWRHLENFSTNAVILHLASTSFDASDYIYDFSDYLKTQKNASDGPDCI
jgi:hypothetical protein